MIKNEAERIAAAVNIIRPEWSTGLLMKVLGDERMIRRPYADALLALTACALDPETQRPGRVHEKGSWWSVVTAVSGQQGPTYRSIDRDTCIVCGDNRGWFLHGEDGDHSFENPLVARKGELPTPDQRAEIDRAIEESKRAATAEREAKAEREIRDMDDVLASHQPDTDAEEYAMTQARHQSSKDESSTEERDVA